MIYSPRPRPCLFNAQKLKIDVYFATRFRSRETTIFEVFYFNVSRCLPLNRIWMISQTLRFHPQTHKKYRHLICLLAISPGEKMVKLTLPFFYIPDPTDHGIQILTWRVGNGSEGKLSSNDPVSGNAIR